MKNGAPYRGMGVNDYNAEMMLLSNPDPMNTMSVHLYDLQEKRFGRTVQAGELIDRLMGISRGAKKPLFVGEFGVSETIGHDEARQQFERWVTAIDEKQVPLAAVWVFDLANQPENMIRGDNVRVYQLERIRELNERYSNKTAR